MHKANSQPTNGSGKVAYIMSRFPKLTETFILLEMAALEKQGSTVEVYPLLREKTSVMHPEAEQFVEAAHFQPFLSWAIVRANLHYLRRNPGNYLRTVVDLVRGTWGSFRFFTGALGIFPKSVYFASHMIANEITHVHAHFASHPTAAAFIIHRLEGIPYSFTAHGSDIHRDRTMLAEKVAEAAFVVPISTYNQQVILDACQGRFADKMFVIHCGVDTQFFDTSAAPAEQNTDDTPILLCVGTLHEVKGQTHLIEACRLLHQRGIEVSCHFIGDGPDRQALTQQADESGLADNIHFHGLQPRAQVAQWLRRADIVVAPSVPSSDGRREGIPVALMEAMASSTPVVASDLSGIPELVKDGENGLLVEPGNPDSIATALERLIKSPELRRRFSQAARNTILASFDLNTNAALLQSRFSPQGRDQ